MVLSVGWLLGGLGEGGWDVQVRGAIVNLFDVPDVAANADFAILGTSNV